MPDELLTWCVVANVATETHHGEDGLDVRAGVHHFAPRAKLWVLPPQWGDGSDNVIVVGQHRGGGHRRPARMVLPRHYLVDFRVRGVYSPAATTNSSDHGETTRCGCGGPATTPSRRRGCGTTRRPC